MSAIEGLEPRRLWEQFEAVSRIPRCSGNEEGAREHVLAVAGRQGLHADVDPAGNVRVRKPAAAGREGAPCVVLQAHLDMVCEKNRDTEHDFEREGLRLLRDGPWIKADGTTLGADNGIGVAAMLAVMEDPSLEHGPLELLFTVDEETGLTGATALEEGLIRGRVLLNLDSEEEGTLYIGCAGGLFTDLHLPVSFEEAPAGHASMRIRVGGLEGGHSGLDIDKGRGNAVKLLARLLQEAGPRLGMRLAHLEGGDKRNAIPRECDALTLVPDNALEELERAVADHERVFRQEHAASDPGLYVRVERAAGAGEAGVLSSGRVTTLLDLLVCLPHGVLAMSPTVPGQVETSTNVSAVRTRRGEIVVQTKQRSARASGAELASNMTASAGRLAGAEVVQSGRYPGWTPDPDSPILALAREVYRDTFSREPETRAIHAGLETGIIGGKVPGMDMLSFGPTLASPHSPEERVDIESVGRFWTFLVALLARVAA